MQISTSGDSAILNHSLVKQNMHIDDSQQLVQWLSDIADQRDKQAFALIFNWFSPKIIRFGIQKLNTETMAHELLQDTMTNVWRKAYLFDVSKGAATTWVYTIMRNACFDILRKINNQREDNLSDDIWPMIEAECVVEHQFIDHLMTQQMSEYVEQLPEAQKLIVKGVYFRQLSQQQLAMQLNIPVGTVKSRLRLALSKLREQIGDQR